MLPTYPAVLRDNHLEWGADGPPPVPPSGVRVHVTILDQPAPASRGLAMAAALEALAASGGPSVADPAEWQRDARTERHSPAAG